MLRNMSHLVGATVEPDDGAIGSVKQAYFDDHAWTVRYLVVDTGTWLLGREVLISPYSVRPPLGDDAVRVALTCEQVRNSPAVDTHQPVSRRHEQEFLAYYGYPTYWGGTDLWAMGSYPLVSLPADGALAASANRPHEENVPPEDIHLRSTAEVGGYDIEAADGSLGHVADFVFDDETWTIRYLIVTTRNVWPGGRKVLIATRWIERIEWGESKVRIGLTREQIKASPEYDEVAALDRAYEARLHQAYGRTAYWDEGASGGAGGVRSATAAGDRARGDQRTV